MAKRVIKEEIFVCSECGAKEPVSEDEVGQLYGCCWDCYVNIDFQSDDY